MNEWHVLISGSTIVAIHIILIPLNKIYILCLLSFSGALLSNSVATIMVKRHETLRQVQQSLLKDMLNLEGAPWKVLILDSFVQKLISPVMRVAELRDLGVTLHLYFFLLLY